MWFGFGYRFQYSVYKQNKWEIDNENQQIRDNCLDENWKWQRNERKTCVHSKLIYGEVSPLQKVREN